MLDGGSASVQMGMGMGLLTIIYWVLLILMLIGALGAFASEPWPWWPRLNGVVILVLFIIIGLKILHPTW